MNLKNDIFKALDGKGYDDFTKIRWIYLYVCEKFSYDTRYIYAPQSMKDIINISYIQYKDLPPIFYLLRKEKNSFKIREIFKDEALELLSQYENPFCQYMLEQAAKQLPTSKKGNIIY